MLLCPSQVGTVQRCGPRLLLLVLDLLRVAAHSAVLGGGAADRGDPLISVRVIVHRQEKVAVRNLRAEWSRGGEERSGALAAVAAGGQFGSRGGGAPAAAAERLRWQAWLTPPAR